MAETNGIPSPEQGGLGQSQNPANLQSQLADAQNKARMQQIRQSAQSDPLGNRPQSSPQQRTGTGAEQYTAQPGTTVDQRLAGATAAKTQETNANRSQQNQGQDNANPQSKSSSQGQSGENEDKQGRLSQLTNAARRLRQNTKQQTEGNPDYPYPISNAKFLIWIMVAMFQDGIEFLFDFIGIGWIVGPILLALFTIPIYIYLILRHVPKSMRFKYIIPSTMASAVNLIPGLGEILPEVTTVAIGGFIMLKRYESGAASLTDASTTTKRLASGGATAGKS